MNFKGADTSAGAAGAVQFAVAKHDVQSRFDAALLVTLGLVAAYFLIYPVWRSQFLIEIWFTEGWNAYFQDMAAAGGRIYPSPNDLIINNYPPLSFYAVGLLGKAAGIDNLFLGRAISLASLIGTALGIFSCIRTLTCSRVDAALGSLWFVAIMSHNFTSYVGANDPQLTGEAIMTGGLAWMLARNRTGRSAFGPLLIMVVGGFWKHNMIAIPLTAVIWLSARRGRAAVPAIAASAAAAAVGLAACGFIFGMDFFRNLFVARNYSVDHILGNIGHLQWCALAGLIWLSWLMTSRSIGAKFTSLHVPIALASCLMQWLGDKVFGNAEFDLIIALAIAVGVTCAEIESCSLTRYTGMAAAKVAVVAMLVVRLLATDRQEPLLVMFDQNFRSLFHQGEQSVRNEAQQIAAIEGDVWCFYKVVCRAAGKPFVVDDFLLDELVATRTMGQSDVDDLLRARHITVLHNRPVDAVTLDTSLSHAVVRARP